MIAPRLITFLFLVWASLALLGPAGAEVRSLTVFAAASLKDALDEANASFTKAKGTPVRTSYAASSALMKQIEQGAPADVFISADVSWMDYGSDKGLVNNSTRVNLFGNRLVLIAPKDSTVDTVALTTGFDISGLAGNGRIAVADVRAVPAGRYARAALEALGMWTAAQPKLAMAENVRAALALVARGEAPLGIVYETDAKVDLNVKILGRFPEDSHPAIIYPAAATKTAKFEAASYLAFLRSATANAIFEKFGFTILAEPSR